MVIDIGLKQHCLKKHDLVSRMKGYMGYKHVSCISVNDEVVHGVPADKIVLKMEI